MDSSIQLCNSYLTNSRIEFIRREANEIAYELAKATTFLLSFRIFNEIPSYITDLIFN